MLQNFVLRFYFQPDLGKFRHFGKTSKLFGYYLRVYFVLGKILNPIWHILGYWAKFSLFLSAQIEEIINPSGPIASNYLPIK